MPTTRKKTIKTIYKDEESEGEAGDFSDSGSEAKISEASSSEEDLDDAEDDKSSGDDFRNKAKKRTNKPPPSRRKPKPFAKELIKKINKQDLAIGNDENIELPGFSIKDLTDADKLLPSVLNLSESDSSDDESQNGSTRKKAVPTLTSIQERQPDSDDDGKIEYRDVWSANIPDNSEDIAKKTFMELEKHNSEIEKTKASVEGYVAKNNVGGAFDVKDLLAQGEEVVEKVTPVKKKGKAKKRRDDSDSEVEDWEEVNESKIPQQGLQLIVELPNSVCRKSKTVDVEMMMKRKINRVKKEYQVYMHKVHILCWLGHGNYVSRVLNDRDVMAAALAMVPKGCYPEERLTMIYVEQITTWYKDKLTLKQDKHEHKFRPKAPPLKDTILNQIKNRITTTKKYNIFIFVAMLRALGLQCRIMFNFVAVSIRPHSSELCSLSTKSKDDNNKALDKSAETATGKSATKKTNAKCTKKMAQVDGIDDTFSETDSENDNTMQIDDSSCNNCENMSEYVNIMQVDGSDDTQNTRSTRATRAKKVEVNNASDKKDEGDDVSPPKRPKTNVESDKNTESIGTDKQKETIKPEARVRRSAKNKEAVLETADVSNTSKDKQQEVQNSQAKRQTKSKNESNDVEVSGDSNKPRQASRPPITRKSVKNKDTSKTETTSTNKVINADNDKPQEVVKAQIRKPAKNNVTNKTTDGPKVSEQWEPPKSPLRRKIATSNDGNASVKNNRDASKSPQTKNKTSLSTDKMNGVVKVNSSPKTSLNVNNDDKDKNTKANAPSPRKTRANSRNTDKTTNNKSTRPKTELPSIIVTEENSKKVESDFFTRTKEPTKRGMNLPRKRSHTTIANEVQTAVESKDFKPKIRTKSAPGNSVEKSKYFDGETATKKPRLNTKLIKKEEIQDDKLRVSHRDLSKQKRKPKNDVTGDLVDIIKSRIRTEKAEARKGIVKGKVKEDSGDDSDFLPVEDSKNLDSDDDFKPTKISPRPISKVSPKPGTSKKIDRRVLSSDDDPVKTNKMDVWCEVFVEELEQWIAVDAIRGKVHCSNDLYTQATHPICYVLGWDNNNYLKDLTRRYVPHWNTVTRKQRAEPEWWNTALQPWLGPKTARDREEDEYLDRMQLEAPLPKSIAEYKNHPLYALKRHLLKYEALYPPDASTLGFVRGEAVYARDCVYTCRSRDTWLKEAKVVKLGEQPYKIVKARPKWDKLSNKLITDKPLEVFGPWQVQDYEPPTAENGIVPRNAYGNVELFKDCMLPKKTVHIKLPGLNRVAKKLNIDCAPAMTGFDFNGGWSHPVYDGFVVCEEFEEIITEAWVKDQEDQERREREKMELRVFGNWKRLIRGLMIRERLKLKYGFQELPKTATHTKTKGPRLVVKKK